MAWDEWSDKIQHDAPGTGQIKNRGWYYVDHDGIVPKGMSPRFSDLTYFHHPDKKRIDIDLLQVDPDFQQNGVGEALMRKLHENYPDYKINPGSLSPAGQAFYERMLEKEPAARDLVTARRLAMAWEDYKDKIQGGCENCDSGRLSEGRYTIPQAGAFLDYYHKNHMGEPKLFVSGIYTHPSNRNDGVAEALMRRMVEDHPGMPINPGYMTSDGQAFHDRVLEKDPAAKELVTAALQTLVIAESLGESQ